MPWLPDVALSLLVPALALMGWPAVRAFRSWAGLDLDAGTTFAASLAVALGFVQAGGMLLGGTSLLQPSWVLAWLAAGTGIAAALWLGQGRPRPRLDRPTIAAAATALALVPALLMATVPPWYRDEMAYHLSLPREFAVAGGYVQPDDNLFASFPLGYESILAMLHALGSAPDRFPPFNPRLVGVWTILAAALAVGGLARTAGVNRRRAAWAAPFLLLVPTVLEFGPSAYVEPYLLLWTTLALTAVLEVQRGHPRALWAAVLGAGAAASTKYPGLAVCAFLAALLLTDVLRRPPDQARAALGRVVAFAAGALALASPFYLRNLLQRGNPFFPVAFELLGGRGWDAERAAGYAITLDAYGLGRTPADLLLAPLRLFTATDLHDGFEGSIGPVIGVGALLGLAAALRLARRPGAALPLRGVLSLALFALLWSLFWFNTVQQVRYFLVALPALLALALLGLEQLSRVQPRTAAAVLAAGLVGATAWTAPRLDVLWRRQATGAWLTGSLSRDRLLSLVLPEAYAFEAELESLVPPAGRVWLVWMRGHTYYLRRPYRLDVVFEAWRFEALLDRSPTPDAALAELRRDGISHVLVHHGFFLQGGNADLRPGRTRLLQQRFAALVSDQALTPVGTWGAITLYAVRAP